MRSLIIATLVSMSLMLAGCVSNPIQDRTKEIAVEESNEAAVGYLKSMIKDGQLTPEEAEAIQRRVMERFTPEHSPAR